MQLLHLTEDENGVSHFGDAGIALAMGDFAPPAPPLLLSEAEVARALVYLTLPAGWDGAKHRSPRRQVAFCLSGRLRVEAGDGEVREIGPGGIWRMEDVAGSGHTTAVLGDEEVRLAIVQLE
ncbi:cupin domain-containing protein [Defluviimonas salinarum]|uniref:Cupin domain-containing protein n=1 Tax=Defluviimonas salinarum TaxID=2992147 RepID=A0ABT3J021_9RHOB|nr:cupin domain-containing protein [Defluviimonas salinarum]MCW3781027.1 cupin domain-containing protein [Defluviimonas salinarum]